MRGCFIGVRAVFEYQSHRRRPPWIYLLGVIYLVFAFGVQILIDEVDSRFGRATAALVPGVLLTIVTGALYAIANQKRDRLLEAQGIVESAEHYVEPDVDDDEQEPSADGGYVASNLSIRLELPNGETRRIDLYGYYPYERGDTVFMLYQKEDPGGALPKEAWNLKLFEDCKKLGCLSVVLLVAGCAFLWIFF